MWSLTNFQLFFLSIYRIFFHPLAKYPGPLLAKLTDSHSTYHAYYGTRHLEFYRMHQKYGPIVRYGPNHVSINSASALKTIYGHKSNVKKSMFYSVFPPTKHTFNTHSSIDKAAHARKRRVLSHAFSESAVRSMERYVTGNIRTFCEKLGGKGQQGAVVLAEKQNTKGWSQPQNMADWCNYLTFDVMGDLCFGKAFEMLERPENRHVIDLIGNAAHMHLIVSKSSQLCNDHVTTCRFALQLYLLPLRSIQVWSLILMIAWNESTSQKTQPSSTFVPTHPGSTHSIYAILQRTSSGAD